ncbi:MAG: TetR/AcrR family transcriptional regulator, cholesterol catabolism regulator [Clostridiales bacterium]|nr:TetR/AcrR family transcriptional regulator, cholesterol catabolism regulator [Clostridiales bacterium]
MDIRNQILTSASDLMIEKGIKGTSLKDIASTVGISKGTLYYHYAAKEDIIYDLADAHLSQINDQLLYWIEHEAAVSTNTTEQIFKVILEKIVYAETRGKFHFYLIANAITDNEALRDRFIEKYEDWRKTLSHGLKLVLKDRCVNCEMLSYLILATLDGLIVQRMFSREPLPLDGIAKILAELS